MKKQCFLIPQGPPGPENNEKTKENEGFGSLRPISILESRSWSPRVPESRSRSPSPGVLSPGVPESRSPGVPESIPWSWTPRVARRPAVPESILESRSPRVEPGVLESQIRTFKCPSRFPSPPQPKTFKNEDSNSKTIRFYYIDLCMSLGTRAPCFSNGVSMNFLFLGHTELLPGHTELLLGRTTWRLGGWTRRLGGHTECRGGRTKRLGDRTGRPGCRTKRLGGWSRASWTPDWASWRPD